MNETLEIIKKYNIRAYKGLSQNFLIDENIIKKIVESTGIDEKTAAIEIGGGVGSLTKELLRCAGSVTVIEIDKRLCEVLRAEYGERLRLINGDVMKTDIGAIVARERGLGFSVKVCANLPYHLTSPVIMRLLEETEGIHSMTLMMQKEVAERLVSAPGTKEYGAITVAVGYYADARLVANVPPSCFMPRPGVQSSVVNFTFLEKKRVLPQNEKLMFEVIRAAFGQRRKTLQNALSNQLLPKIGIDSEKLAGCLNEAGITKSARGETLGLAEFALIADKLQEAIEYKYN